MTEILLDEHVGRIFERVPLHHQHEHAGILLYYDQTLPDDDPEGLARTIETVLQQYDADALADELVDLGEPVPREIGQRIDHPQDQLLRVGVTDAGFLPFARAALLPTYQKSFISEDV